MLHSQHLLALFLFMLFIFTYVSVFFFNRFLFSCAMFFMCGTIGVWGSGVFVRKIYRDVKID